MKIASKTIVGGAEFDAALTKRIAAVEANFRPELELRTRDYLLVTVIAGVLPVLAVLAGFAGLFG